MGAGFEPGETGMMLDIQAIDTFYGETQVLFEVSLRVKPGEVAQEPRQAHLLTYQEAWDNLRARHLQSTQAA